MANMMFVERLILADALRREMCAPAPLKETSQQVQCLRRQENPSRELAMGELEASARLY